MTMLRRRRRERLLSPEEQSIEDDYQSVLAEFQSSGVDLISAAELHHAANERLLAVLKAREATND